MYIFKLTVVFASNILLSILHNQASLLHHLARGIIIIILRGGRREFSDEADKNLKIFRHQKFRLS